MPPSPARFARDLSPPRRGVRACGSDDAPNTDHLSPVGRGRRRRRRVRGPLASKAIARRRSGRYHYVSGALREPRAAARAEKPVEELRRVARGARRLAHAHASRPQGHHRTERRRQDHAVQSHHRNFPADVRAGAAGRPRCHLVAEPPAHRARHGAHVSDHQPVSEAHRARQCAAGDPGPARVEIRDVAISVVLPRGIRQGAWPTRARGVPRPQGHGGAPSLARRAASARDRAGARRRSAHSAARRAGRRPLLGRVGGDGAVPPAPRPRNGDPADRARHGRRLRRRGRHLGPAFRRDTGKRAGRTHPLERKGAGDLSGDRLILRFKSMAILDVQDVHTYYGDAYVLQGLSLKLEQGAILGLLGRNGVGKTTLVNSIVGFTPPRRGKIYFKGADITGNSSFVTVRGGMGLVPQGRRVFPTLTVEENLLVAERSPERHGWTLARVYALFPRLNERRSQRARTLSGGEQQMLAIGRGLMTNPDCLIMDEPSEGLAPIIIQGLWEAIAKLRQEGLSILLVEQNAALALKLVDFVHVISKGRVVYSAPPAELSQNQAIKSRFLGI